MGSENAIMAIIIILGTGFLSIILGAIFKKEFRISLFASEGEGSYLGLNVKGVTFLVLEMAFIAGLVLLGLKSVDANYAKSSASIKVAGLIVEKSALETKVDSFQESASELNARNEELNTELIEAKREIESLGVIGVDISEKDKLVEKALANETRALKEAVSLKAALGRLENELASKSDFLFADILTKTHVNLPRTPHKMHVVNISMFAKKMQLMFIVDGDESKKENVYMVTGEIQTVTIGNDKFTIKVLGVDPVDKSAGLLISKAD